ncbi:unnamed protein product [Malus baccata var. baccata]
MIIIKSSFRANLGVNAILAVSIAACKAGAAQKEVPLYKHIADLSGNGHLTLPVPAFTVISGGKRAGNNLAIQEIMILPIGASKFEEALQMGSETYHHLKVLFTSTVDFGDYIPCIAFNDERKNLFPFCETC